jgi:hypothetical protein
MAFAFFDGRKQTTAGIEPPSGDALMTLSLERGREPA